MMEKEKLMVYCSECNITTEHREKGLRNTVTICNICDTTNSPVSLIKSNGEMHGGSQVKFIEWSGDELGSRSKKVHEEPQVGFSCIIDPQYLQYTWLTTPITEITSDVMVGNIRIVNFKTKNSTYKLSIVKTNNI